MKFLCVVALDAEIGDAMTEEDWTAMQADCAAYDGKLERDGILLAAEALESTVHARTVRVRKGRAMMTDGPFTETKEHVAGFVLVEARDAAHAMEIAQGLPMARIGAVEVRPVMIFGDG